jgi:serine protease Do
VPRADEIDERGLFLVQDPDLTSKVLPLFRFSPQATEERPIGQGTTFRVDPWSTCATAFHVVEDLFEVDAAGTALVLKPDIRLAALEVPGIGYGRVRIPDGAWRPFAGSFTFAGIETPPFDTARVRNMTELVALRIRPPASRPSGTPHLPLDFRRWQPRVGERVLALGYANLDRCEEGENDDRAIRQYLYGSYGEITDIEEADPQRSRPWPVIRLQAEWPGGMSGGPVVNEAGHVIGIVSTGIGGQVGTAAIFRGWNMPAQTFRWIDPNNPGWFYCYAAFDADGEVRVYGQDRAEVGGRARERGLTDIGAASFNPTTTEFARHLR